MDQDGFQNTTRTLCTMPSRLCSGNHPGLALLANSKQNKLVDWIEQAEGEDARKQQREKGMRAYLRQPASSAGSAVHKMFYKLHITSPMALSVYAACAHACVDSVHSVLQPDLQPQYESVLPETEYMLRPHRDNVARLMALPSVLLASSSS
jgi:hypothetical protein